MKIKKQTLNSLVEYILIVVFFVLSLINIPLLIISFLVSLIYLKQRHVGILKILILLVFRFIISEGIDNVSGNSIVSYLKYLTLLVIAPIYLIINYKTLKRKQTIAKFMISTVSLMIIFILISIIATAFPLIALMKVINYFLPLMIIILLMLMIEKKEDFFFWTCDIFKIIIVFSMLFIISPIGYLRNGISLQGIVNHPNLFGILLVIAIQMFFIEVAIKKKLTIIQTFIILLSIYELLLTNSRTSLLSLFVCITIFFIISKIKLISKIITLFVLLIGAIILYLTPATNEFVTSYIQKGQSSDQILLSRYGQIDNTIFVLHESPIFGIGFGIPVNRTSLELNSFVFEAGNLLFGLLIYVGIFGAICYLIYLFYIIFINKKINRNIFPLFIATLLINMGELVMFSSNNVGIICYIVWGFYLQERLGKKYEAI
ncbi:O-antigen ligase family protein [Staphylococcus saprophyticus]|uniref:O-antigen ligase family protein n=1 Tax=Staphylococcus saprophyticus TaxID=29385 RepID=UPI0034DD9D20